MRAYRVAYDGRPFHGFQRQPDVPTVEDTLFGALADLGMDFGERPTGYAAAGRTDAGVSALGQTVAFEAPDWLSPRALSAALPQSVAAWASASAPSSFHATHDAAYREYTYHLYAPDAEADRVNSVERRVSGTHDFHNLSADDEGTVRDLDLTLELDGEYLVVVARSDGFPRQLVRRLVSLADAVVSGAGPLDRIERVLDPEPLDGPEGIPPAPAYPLVLTDVGYDLDFEVDAAAAADARAHFDGHAIEHGTRERVARSIEGGLGPGPESRASGPGDNV